MLWQGDSSAAGHYLDLMQIADAGARSKQTVAGALSNILLLQATDLLRDWRFPNTYCLSKSLAERMVLQHHSRSLPVAVVRPSIIGGLMGAPNPGFSGNAAGATGAALAIASGRLW